MGRLLVGDGEEQKRSGRAARLVAERRRGASTVGSVDFFYYTKILNRNCLAPIFLFWDVKIFLFKFFQLISQKTLFQNFSRQFYSISPTFFLKFFVPLQIFFENLLSLEKFS